MNDAGWEAVDQAVRSSYADVEPTHWATLYRWRLGGPDPLDGVSAYPRLDPVPHWHYVGYGMSAWGFELTFRLARDPAENEAPLWAARFLQNLARYAHGWGQAFEAGHVLDTDGPIALERDDTSIRGSRSPPIPSSARSPPRTGACGSSRWSG